MPIIKSAVKRAKQTTKRRERNVGIKRDIKSAVKAFTDKPSATTLSAAQSEIDTAVKKNLLKKNTAARRKANLSRIAKAAGVKLASAKKPVAKTATKVSAKSSATTATKTATPAKKASTASKTTATKKPAAKKPVAKKPATKK